MLRDLKKPEKRFRPEIEGVRTVATMLVAIYHIWLGRVSGGIDVFFIHIISEVYRGNSGGI